MKLWNCRAFSTRLNSFTTLISSIPFSACTEHTVIETGNTDRKTSDGYIGLCPVSTVKRWRREAEPIVLIDHDVSLVPSVTYDDRSYNSASLSFIIDSSLNDDDEVKPRSANTEEVVHLHPKLSESQHLDAFENIDDKTKKRLQRKMLPSLNSESEVDSSASTLFSTICEYHRPMQKLNEHSMSLSGSSSSVSIVPEVSDTIDNNSIESPNIPEGGTCDPVNESQKSLCNANISG